MKKYKTLEEFFADQDPNKLEQVMLVREIILTAEPNLHENLKWNAPNYVYNGEDRITLNLLNKDKKVKLLVHMGAKIKEDKAASPLLQQDSGIVEWQSDIRGVVNFKDMNDIESKREALTNLIRAWLLLKV